MPPPTKFKLTGSCEVPGILYALCHDAQNGLLYIAGSDRSVYCVDLAADKPEAEKKWANHENYVSALAFLNGNVISASYDGRINWTSAKTGQLVTTLEAHDGWIRDLAVFPDGKRMVSVGDDMLVKLWNAETGKLVNQFDGHAKQTPQGYATALYTVAITPDGKHVVSGDRIGAVCIWEASSGKLVQQLRAPTFYTYDASRRVRSIGGIRSLGFSPDGSTLAISGIGKVTNVDGFVGPCRLELWDWQTAKRTRTCQGRHKAILNHVIYHTTKPFLIAVGGGDSGGILALWDVKKEQPIYTVKPKGHVQKLVLDPDEQHIYAAGHGGFQIWTCSEV